jgi:hypothetical protein
MLLLNMSPVDSLIVHFLAHSTFLDIVERIVVGRAMDNQIASASEQPLALASASSSLEAFERRHSMIAVDMTVCIVADMKVHSPFVVVEPSSLVVLAVLVRNRTWGTMVNTAVGKRGCTRLEVASEAEASSS